MAFFQQMPQQPSIAQGLGAGLGAGIGGGIQEQLGQFFQERQKQRTLQDFFDSEFGQKLSDENKSLIAGVSKGLLPPQALTKALSQGDPEVDSENFEIMKDAFGDRFAKIWKAAGQGERTALTNAALDARFRGLDIQDLLSKAGAIEEKEKGEQITEDEFSLSDQLDTPQGEIDFSEKTAFPEYNLDTSGMTPKDVTTYKSNLRKENAKPFQEAVKQAEGTNQELSSIKVLNQLNESRKLPENIGQQIGQGINPKTGKIAIPMFASTEAQTFEKTINEFTTKAKDTFGGRVTNFELQQFMSRLPRMINSYEGRKAIIQQMELLSKIRSIYNTSLRDVYEHYGLDNITQEDAEKIARKNAEKQTSSLWNEYEQVANRISAFDSSSKSAFNLEKLPPPAKHTGRIVEDTKGNRYKSTGKTWRKL